MTTSTTSRRAAIPGPLEVKRRTWVARGGVARIHHRELHENRARDPRQGTQLLAAAGPLGGQREQQADRGEAGGEPPQQSRPTLLVRTGDRLDGTDLMLECGGSGQLAELAGDAVSA